MLLALDIGNTQITLALYYDNNWKKIYRIQSDKMKNSDFYKSKIYDIFKESNLRIADISEVIISSVVPTLTDELKLAAQEVFNKDIFVINSKLCCNLKINIDDPATLGNDILCGCAAAAKYYPLPVLVFDFGSATTMCLVDKELCFQGGIILSGIQTSVDALSKKCELIDTVNISNSKQLIAKNTVDCINSGICYGNAAMVDNLSTRVENQLNQVCTIVLTGGLSGYIIPYCEKKIINAPNLVLDGMRIIYEYNKNTISNI